MAYSAPSTVSTGDLCTASIWNADVVANAIALHAGAMAVTSQAVGDLLYASSTTQFARIAAVATGQVLTSAGTGTVPAWSSNVDLGGTLDVTGRLLVDSAGPSALGQAVSGTTGLVLGGAFTSDGSSNYAYKVNIAGALTGASGDTARLALFRVGGTGITTHATSETTTLVTSAYIAEPSLTKGSGSTVTNATALYIDAAPSGATNNYAIWVDAGATQLDGTLDVGGATTLDSTLTVVNDVAVDTDTLFVDVSADNVGIGVTDPDVALDVSGGDNVLDIFRITQRVSGAAAYGLQVGLADTGDPVFQRLVNDTATESFRIVRGTGVVKFNANVGIGTTTPTSPAGVNRILEIEDGTHAGLVLHDSTADAWEIYANGTDLSIGYNNAVNIRIEGDTGNCAIGAPAAGAGDLFGAALTVNKDYDNKCYFGKAFISSTGSGMTADRAHWGHVDHEVGVRYAIMQHGNGDTNLNAPTGQAIYFNINASRVGVWESTQLSVDGALSKGSGSFNIQHPHPSKADTHRLVHSFVESPGADLIYRSTVTLVDGQATVDLDEAAGMTSGTWVLLCRDEQVFTSNETGWKHVRGSVSGSTLTIDCEESDCTDTVSWMVVACRKDQHMYDTKWTDEDGYPIIEPLKPADRGYDDEEDSPSASASPSTESE